MNEKEQISRLEYWINKCPMFKDYKGIYTNVQINNKRRTVLELDYVGIYSSFDLTVEVKGHYSRASIKKKNKQIKKYKRNVYLIQDKLGLERRTMYFFSAFFDNDLMHIEYEGKK